MSARTRHLRPGRIIRRGRGVISCLLLVVLTGAATQGSAASLTGRVIRILSGDALVLTTDAGAQHRIRVAGIAAPPPSEPYGRRAGGRLSDVAAGRFAVAELGGSMQRGEYLGRITVGDMDLGLDQLHGGLARFCPARLPGALRVHADSYALAEREARTAGRGLWRNQARAARGVHRTLADECGLTPPGTGVPVAPPGEGG